MRNSLGGLVKTPKHPSKAQLATVFNRVPTNDRLPITLYKIHIEPYEDGEGKKIQLKFTTDEGEEVVRVVKIPKGWCMKFSSDLTIEGNFFLTKEMEDLGGYAG